MFKPHYGLPLIPVRLVVDAVNREVLLQPFPVLPRVFLSPSVAGMAVRDSIQWIVTELLAADLVDVVALYPDSGPAAGTLAVEDRTDYLLPEGISPEFEFPHLSVGYSTYHSGLPFMDSITARMNAAAVPGNSLRIFLRDGGASSRYPENSALGFLLTAER